MSKTLLPELSIARGMAPLLLSPQVSDAVPADCPHYDAAIRHYGRRTFDRFHYIAQVTSGIDLSDLQSADIASWPELAEQAHNVIGEQIAATEVKPQTDVENVQTAHDMIDRDGRLGALQIVAFLDVIPKILFRRDFDDPSAKLAASARLSKALMVRWSKLDDTNDARLTYGVAYPKPEIDDENPYVDLTFHPKWFTEQPSGAIGLNPAKLAHVQGEDGKRLKLATSRAIMGCPAVQLVPALYDVMVDVAETRGLFTETYQIERQNHGYIDKV